MTKTGDLVQIAGFPYIIMQKSYRQILLFLLQIRQKVLEKFDSLC